MNIIKDGYMMLLFSVVLQLQKKRASLHRQRQMRETVEVFSDYL